MKFPKWLKWLWMVETASSPGRPSTSTQLNISELDAENRAKYEEAKRFRQEFMPEENLDYDWVFEYAKEKYDKMLKNLEQLDDKADALIKYLGGGTAFVAFGAIVGAGRGNALAILLMAPSVMLALWAIAYAIRPRLPTPTPVPPKVDEAVSYAEAFRDRGKYYFIGQWHETCQLLGSIITAKAARIIIASKYYYRALLFLLLPVLIWPICKLLEQTEPIRLEVNSPPLKMTLTSPPNQIRITPSGDHP